MIPNTVRACLLGTAFFLSACGSAQSQSRDVDMARSELAAISDDTTRQAVLEQMIRTAPGQGLSPREIDYLAHDFGKKSYNTVSGTWRFKDEANWLVLKDGWAYRNPVVAPSELDAELSRALEPERWVRADTLKLERDFPKAGPGARLDVAVERPDVYGNGFSSGVTRKGLTLRKDGTFETSLSVMGGTTEEATSATGNRVVIVTREDGSGRTGTLSGTTGNTVTRSRTNDRDAAPSNRGTYMIEGYEITLAYDNGIEVRLPFAAKGRMEDGKLSTSVIMGNTYYFD